MAWLYQQKGKSQNWFIGYRHNGVLVCRTTKTSDKAEAAKELAKVELLFGAARAGSLTEELFKSLTGSPVPKLTLAAEMEDWLRETANTTASNTWSRYKFIAEEFKTFLGANERKPMLSAVTSADVQGYLTEKRKSTAASTVNVVRKILAGFFKRAIQNNRLRDNPVSPVKAFKAQKGERVQRRSFTVEELQTIYNHAPDEFWRYMIIGGAYTGLRMGDLICMKWGSVDLQRNFITVSPDKTDDKEIQIPIAKPFRAILASLKAKSGKVKSSDFIWPEQAEKHGRYKSKTGYFSNQFYNDILVKAQLVNARPTSHKAKEGGNGRRQTSEISFHCLRHTFVSWLRATGSNQAVSKELAGHHSDQVNRLYTHVEEKSLVAAINLLPEFVK